MVTTRRKQWTKPEYCSRYKCGRCYWPS